MTPTQYIRIVQKYLKSDKDRPTPTETKLEQAWSTFTYTQRSFCAMVLMGSDKATKAIRKQKRKGTN